MRKTHVAAIIAVLAFFGLFIGNFGQYQLAAMPIAVFTKLGLTSQQFASIMTAPMMLSIVLSFVSGSLMDKFGIKPVVAVGFILSSIGFIIRPFATTYSVMLIAMILTGLGCCIFNANMSKIVGQLFPAQMVGRIIGVIMLGATVSMTAAYSTAVFFPTLEIAFWFSAGFSVVVMLAWFVLVSTKALKGDGAARETSVPIKEAIGHAAKSKDIWFMGLAFAFMLGGIMVTSTFQPLALITLRGFSESYANSFATTLTIGNIAGTFIGPFLVLRAKRMKPFLVAILIIAVVCTVFMIEMPPAFMYGASFILGFVRSAFITIVISFPFFFKGIGPKYAGTAGGITSSLMVLGAVVIPTYIVAPLAKDFHQYFWAAAVCMALCLVFTLLMTDIKKVQPEA
ncbi:MFS transporter [Parasporobacterium paucivorans]|uniref:MFS transporter, NNP family, nitrate/nitrite transporter n=1 Tax=Parasporobacterium paucivorans DSM 15970 TaxID=1122934 RepID=A0A1M6HVM6_9FIRM|nr:MFS transporter [Parasporobacterium paucivorans]SHJ26265.1 MFS transporter, NNP family, nitrate/nitrite transporter [Parasporobacterium paucivorans DSM 15970]